MKTYEIKRWTGRWSDIPTLEISERYLDTPENVWARAQISYDDDFLRVRLETEEYEHRCEEKPPFGEPAFDSCLEFFFAPIEGDSRYFNIEINSNKCFYLGMGHSMDDLVRLVPEIREKLLSPKVVMKEDGWSVEYTVPISFIKMFFPEFEIFEGKRMRANCFKCADATNPPHYMAWNPLKTENFTFHQSDCFGEMIFTK